jgi:hypothetical protein
MFKKELVDVLKQTAWFVAAVCILPGLLIWSKAVSGSYGAVFAPVLQAGLAFWSVFLGASLFGRERGQGAVEYALSFPYSRFGLLARLAGPRLIVLAALLITAWAAGWVPAILIAGACLPLFLISLSLSTVIENFIFLNLITLAAWYLFGVAAVLLLRGRFVRAGFIDISEVLTFRNFDYSTFRVRPGYIFLFLFSLLIPFLPFLIALLFSFSRFDVRRSAGFRKRFGLAFASCLVVCALLIPLGRAIWPAEGISQFYLTKDLTLVEWRTLSKTLKIHTVESTRKERLDSPVYWPIWDKNKELYFRDSDGSLRKTDLANGRSEMVQKYNRNQRSYWSFSAYESTLVFIETGSRPDEIRLVLVDEPTNKEDRRTYLHPAFRKGGLNLIGIGLREGIRYWICTVIDRSKKSTLRLWDGGRVEEILVKGRLETLNTPHIVNGLLFFSGPEPSFFLQDNGKFYELKKEFSADEGFHAWDGLLERANLNPPAVPFIYGKRGRGQLARINMTTLEIENIGPWTAGDEDAWGYVFRKKNQAYFIGGSRNKKTLDIYTLDEGGMKLIRSIPDTDVNRRGTRYEIFDAGIVLMKGNRTGVYAFPDLRELKFQGVANLK